MLLLLLLVVFRLCCHCFHCFFVSFTCVRYNLCDMAPGAQHSLPPSLTHNLFLPQKSNAHFSYIIVIIYLRFEPSFLPISGLVLLSSISCDSLKTAFAFINSSHTVVISTDWEIEIVMCSAASNTFFSRSLSLLACCFLASVCHCCLFLHHFQINATTKAYLFYNLLRIVYADIVVGNFRFTFNAISIVPVRADGLCMIDCWFSSGKVRVCVFTVFLWARIY